MSRKKGHGLLWTLIVVVAVLVIACITNPGYDAHAKVIKEEYKKEGQKFITDNFGSSSMLLNGLYGLAINSQLGDIAVDNLVKYKSYGIFSICQTRDENDPKTLTFGIFGHVF